MLCICDLLYYCIYNRGNVEHITHCLLIQTKISFGELLTPELFMHSHTVLFPMLAQIICQQTAVATKTTDPDKTERAQPTLSMCSPYPPCVPLLYLM